MVHSLIVVLLMVGVAATAMAWVALLYGKTINTRASAIA
jgi:hypothetical protein